MVHFTKSQTHLCLHFEGENINWKVNKNLLHDGVNETIDIQNKLECVTPLSS